MEQCVSVGEFVQSGWTARAAVQDGCVVRRAVMAAKRRKKGAKKRQEMGWSKKGKEGGRRPAAQ